VLKPYSIDFRAEIMKESDLRVIKHTEQLGASIPDEERLLLGTKLKKTPD